jgi:hypothetical protein
MWKHRPNSPAGTVFRTKEAQETHRAGQTGLLEVAANVRFGSKADIGLGARDVRFTPKSGHQITVRRCPLSAISRHRQATGAFAEAVIRSVELIVQPDAQEGAGDCCEYRKVAASTA